MRKTKWVRKSTRRISRELLGQGHPVGPRTVSRLVKGLGYSLKANVKRLSGKRHPRRDEQFRRIQRQVKSFRRQGLPVLSVDAKKKEIVANFHNAGRIWRQDEIAVADHDFPKADLGRAIPYGLYDVVRNRGFVGVGTSHETAAFGVDCLTLWYRREGRYRYRDAEELLLLCDNGGCNGSRNRLWKCEIQKFADRFGIAVRVAHYPPGASKWNPIEHRMFSFISINWAGQPLKSYETILNYIRTTTTKEGLKINSMLLNRAYPTGVEISDQEMENLNLQRRANLPDWNYVIRPRLN